MSHLAQHSADGSKVEERYDTLVARNDRNKFIFLDKVFCYYNEDGSKQLHGATGSRMVPITECEMERRREEYKDYEYSPLAHIYDEMNVTESWDDWIETELTREGDRLLYDPSYEGKYGDVVQEKCFREDLVDGEVVVVECIGGGRMFSEDSDFEHVYNEPALELARLAEDGRIFP